MVHFGDDNISMEVRSLQVDLNTLLEGSASLQGRHQALGAILRTFDFAHDANPEAKKDTVSINPESTGSRKKQSKERRVIHVDSRTDEDESSVKEVHYADAMDDDDGPTDSTAFQTREWAKSQSEAVIDATEPAVRPTEVVTVLLGSPVGGVRGSHVTMQSRLCIKYLKLTMDNHRIDSSEPVPVFGFLIRMVE